MNVGTLYVLYYVPLIAAAIDPSIAPPVVIAVVSSHFVVGAAVAWGNFRQKAAERYARVGPWIADVVLVTALVLAIFEVHGALVAAFVGNYFCLQDRVHLDRKDHDTIAVVAHSLSIPFIHGGARSTGKAAPFTALLWMQGITIVFHLVYLSKYPDAFDKINGLKWAEYGLSATLGAVAVMMSGDSPDEWLVVLILLSSIQQSLGYLIDTNITSSGARLGIVLASLMQLAEFTIVAVIAGPPPGLMAVYVVWWSLFGVHCGLHASFVSAPGGKFVGGLSERYSKRAWVEAIYSCLGWAAKLAVVVTETSYLWTGHTGVAAAASSAAGVAGILMTW